ALGAKEAGGFGPCYPGARRFRGPRTSLGKDQKAHMALPYGQSLAVSNYLVKKKLQREKRFPLVLMLEILHDCNLTCTGCGRIREYAATIKDLMPYETAMDAVDQAGTPVVTITGGEPMMHPQIGEITAGVLAKNKYIYLC